jgi:hypothetical protein
MSVDVSVAPPAVKRVHAYFAPVDRVAHVAAVFDPASSGDFDLETPPTPWVDLGWIHAFERASATQVEAVQAGAPLTTQSQTRTAVDASVTLRFESWGKLQLSLAAGTQQMNLLKTAVGATASRSGGAAVAAVSLLDGPTATVLQMSADDAAKFSMGERVAVDVDYAGATGFVGSGVSGAFVKTALSDVDYVRRVTLNVGRIASIVGGVVTLEEPLLAGAPTTGMKVSAVVGFCDREGSSFFQEWSAVFVAEGAQGERVVWHYPRLQTMRGIAESQDASAGGYEALWLTGAFRALPVKDAVDGETVVCFRSYLAA